MKIRIFVGVALLVFLAASCTAMMSSGEREKMYGKAVPVITESFASKELRPGDTWKVYLKASDPDGDMRYIVSVLSQPGWGDYPVSLTRIRDENRKELDGYIYLNTLVSGGYEFLNFSNLTLTVQIQDKTGHYSKPVVFPIAFQGRYTQDPPPAGVFQEQPLGPISVTVHPIESGGGHGFSNH